MIVLDTNVISECMQPRPDPLVVQWIDRQPEFSLWTTSISVYEIQMGLLAMPEGKRRTALLEFLARWQVQVIKNRVLDFDSAAAERGAEIAADRRRRGRPGELRDTMIAGIVLANRATLATRNVRHFEEIAGSVVNPWEA